jgi:hypothetical protein
MKFRGFTMLFLVLLLPLLAPNVYADIAPLLGNADPFAVLAGSTVTNVNTTLIDGDLGVSPGLAVTGFPPGIVTGGTIIKGGPVTAQAQIDLGKAFTAEALKGAVGTLVPGGVLNGTYMPGAYFAPSASLTGTIFLNDGGKANSIFIFYTGAGAALTTAPNSVINVSGLSPTDSVFWVVGSSATLGVNSVFYGDILALDSITFNPAARDLCGRALAETGAVSFAGQVGVIENQVSIGCTGNLAGSNGLGGGLPGSGGGVTTPESSTLLLVGCGIFGLLALRRLLSQAVVGIPS